jgi:hypothetical protein
MSFHRACCCGDGGGANDTWVIGLRCDGGALVPPVPVLREDRWRQGSCGIPEGHVIKWDGVCYVWNSSSTSVNLPDGPDGTNYVDVETGPNFCFCFACLEDIDPVDPTPGNPDDGAPNCCPSDTGCTTFGANVVRARGTVTGQMTSRLRCGFSPDVFVERTYNFSADFDFTGTACELNGSQTVTKTAQVWDTCTGTIGFTPRILLDINYNTDDGLIGATAILADTPVAQSGTGTNFQLRLRGGDSDLVYSGSPAVWTRSNYSFNEAVAGACENQFAASGAGRWSQSNGTRVDFAMQMTGALDNLGSCP